MSKSSTGTPAKQLPAKSAWSKGPPQTAPSPRSQSPAPSAQSQSHLTHSRRPSALGQAVPIKDGVSIPRNNVGAAAAKQGSPVTFGSIDDASAPISSSPAAPNPIKESVVKSFGTVPAAPATAPSHINGKPSMAAGRPAGVSANPISGSSSTGPSPSPSASTSATPSAPATTSSGHKLEKPDIKKLFQGSSTPAASAAETQSPSLRPANISSHQQSQNPPPSQFGAHYTPFVPGRPAGPSSGPNNGPSRSPVYARQMPNGSGPRSQPPNGGAPGLSSPRLAPPHTPQQTAGPQPPAPVPGQVPPYGGWAGYYYPPEYMGYPQWGYVQPGMPPQPAHPHGPHLAQPPHAPPHGTMPMSPRNAPQHLPSTPTMSHATPNPIHPPHPPPPLSHTTSSISSVSSPPPTPSSSARLSANSSAFVPRPASKIVFKNQDGKEVNLEALKQTAASPSTAPPSNTGSPFRGSSPGTPKRASIRIETEEQRKKRIAEEEEKQRQQTEADAKAKKAKEEEERKKKEEEDRKKKEEEEEKERVRKAKEEEERKIKEEEERKIKEEEERKLKEEEDRKKKEEEEEKERVRQEEEARKAKEEEERKKEEEVQQRKLKEEQEKKAKEEAERKAAEEEAEKKQKEEAEKAKAADEAAAPEEGELVGTGGDTQITDAKRVKEPLRIDTTTPTSNAADLGRKRPVPGPLDLSAAKVSRQSSLSTARLIEDINTIKYPEGISSPKPELNENAKPGQFRYDRDFLLQFMGVCKEKPPNLPPLDAIGLEPIDPSALAMSRGGSRGGGHRGPSNLGPSRQASLSSFKPGGASGFGGMGNFGTTGNKLTSEERFNLANRSASGGAAALPPQFRGNQMQRTPSQGGRERTRSKRGEKRPPIEGGGKGGFHDRGGSYAQQQQALNLEPVVPLQPTANRWDRKALHGSDVDTPELVDRKVKALLNKLTMEKFDSISDQIITWANKSENEKDGRTLIQVIRLVFEKATDEAAWSEMYARLCRKMMERISPKVQDDGITNAEGKPIAGGQLFRKYLLNRCQEDFERGWVNKETTAAAAASKKSEDDAVQAANEGKDANTEEVALYSDEYYAAQKAKRQGLGLIKFIGELFKLQMLTERIMHECVKKLLGNVENPEEEEIESLCKLLPTVGAILDTPKARAHMDIYFSRMKELTKSANVSSRMQFMLQDVLELRDRKWVARNAAAVPTTIAQLHENAAKEKAASEKEAYRQNTMSRTSSNRGRGRNEFEQQTPDGWAVAGGPPRPPSKAGDLTNFGKIQKAQQMTFGPSSVFSKGKDAKREQPISRSASSSNMFSMLSQQADAAAESKPEPQRKKLVLQPRSVPKDEAPSASNAGSDSGSDDEDTGPAAPADMSDEDAKKKIDEDIKEFFAVRNVDEAENYFTALPSKHHHTLIDKVVSKAVESKAADAELVSNFFERATSKELASSTAFESGFEGIAEFIYDIAVDAPHAPKLFAQMVKAAGLTEDARRRISQKAFEESDRDKLFALLS